MQLPALIFDTYSYLHILADPDSTKNGGKVGQGRYVDFEFNIESATAETITLKGQYHGSKLVLTKATPAESAGYTSSVGTYVEAMERLNSFTTYFKRLTIGTNAYDIQVNPTDRILTFTYFVGETANVFSSPFYYSAAGLVLLQPFTDAGLTISVLQGLQFNSSSGQVNLTIDNAAATIREMPRPVKVDVPGARNFLNSGTGGAYWQGLNGFTLNGVPDALKLSSIPDFNFLGLWPKYGFSNNIRYDLLGFVKLNSARTGLELAYGSAAASRVTVDGRIIYSYLRDYGEVPLAEQPAVTATRQIWTDPQGFYVMKTGNNSVDLVSVKDGKAWLSLRQ
jgi:hypothetical protein